MVDCKNERKIDLTNMLEPKFKHKIVNCNSKIFAIGGFSDSTTHERS